MKYRHMEPLKFTNLKGSMYGDIGHAERLGAYATLEIEWSRLFLLRPVATGSG